MNSELDTTRRLAPLLWALLGLFVMRVVGQLLVATVGVSWLPPMEEWYSGLLAYKPPVVAQVIIIVVYAWVCIDFSREHGFFVRSRRAFGTPLLWFGYVYFASMIVRYFVRMSMYPNARWFGGCIPIAFHCVLASFIILFARWHRAVAVARGV